MHNSLRLGLLLAAATTAAASTTPATAQDPPPPLASTCRPDSLGSHLWRILRPDLDPPREAPQHSGSRTSATSRSGEPRSPTSSPPPAAPPNSASPTNATCSPPPGHAYTPNTPAVVRAPHGGG